MFNSIHSLRQKSLPAKFFIASHALNRSAAFRHLGDFESSDSWVQSSLQALPGNAEASYNGHLDFLKKGKYREGYAAYCLAGRALKVLDRPSAAVPAWDGGNNLRGKNLLVCTENGFGDVFIALRFLPRLKERFGVQKIFVRSHFDELIPFLKKLPAVDEVFGEKEKGTAADFFVSTSLLLYHACESYEDLPAHAYLTADPGKKKQWSEILGAGSELKVGIRWSGNVQFTGNDFRKFDPQLLFDATQLPGLKVFSFQRDDDLRELPAHVRDLAPLLKDWEETAAALANLDILITSCTAVAHMAAALGVETWVCVPTATFHTWAFSPDERRTPWYESVRLFKQKHVFHWDDVFEKIHQALRERAGSAARPKNSEPALEQNDWRAALNKPFTFPQGRRPLMPHERVVFQRRFNQAIQEKSTTQMLELERDFAGALHVHSALSGHYLEAGDFQRGYRGFDLLERSLASNIRLLPQSGIPEWDGSQDLRGKTIIVASGQGQGADLLLARLIPRLRQLGATKIIGAIHVLMADFFAHQNFYDQVLLESNAIQTKADYWVRINSLIYLLNRDYRDINGAPYVTASPARVRIWQKKMEQYARPGIKKIGLRFAGNPQFGGNGDRVFEPRLLLEALHATASLAPSEQVQFFSFQRDADIPELPASVVDLSAELRTWDDTAAALGEMDLVISSCTSVGHLAAAMGRPTWFCVPHDAYHCWRSPWAAENKTPWYDSARIFRQTESRDWESVFKKLEVEFAAWLAAN